MTAGNLITSGSGGSISGTGNILTSGLISATGNITTANKLFVGLSSTTLTNPVAVFSGSGASYDQVALFNSTGTGSSDYVTYGNNGDDNQSWTDMGFTGNTFSDGNYTITGAGDGYIFAQGNTSFGGNLVVATGNTGTTRDIVFSFGFLSANEFLRLQRSTNTILPYANTTANIGSTTKYLNNLYAVSHIGTVVSTTGNITSAANVAGGNILATTIVSGASHIGSVVSATANITGGNIITGGLVSTVGNIYTGTGNAGYVYGNAYFMTGISAAISVTKIENGNSNVWVNSPGGDVTVTAGGVSNVAVFSTGSLTLSGAFGTPKVITANVIVAGNINAMLIGPLTFGNGVGLTVPNSSTVYVYSPNG